MVWFSCFRPHNQSNKAKNTVQPSAEATMQKSSQDGSIQVSKDSSIPSNTEFQASSGPANDDKKELVINESDNEISNTINSVTLARDDHKVNTGLETGTSNKSCLSAGATETQLPNRGLHLFPLLRKCENLKELTLSENDIVRIPPGMLPPQLQFLNLSRNTISIIEGLCQLTQLRVLDLSYNRIRSIGHGLASCSSLEELDLSGNKISEIEGLHRLSKLTILDIRFYKISSAKCLGQLAANYQSLQAISLDGNPAQISVGDETLKRYLHFILPCLVFYNGHHMKISTLSGAADQSVQSSEDSPHFDHILRLDNKTIKKGNRGVVAADKRPSNTSSHASKNKTMKSSKQSKGKHENKAFLPPTEAKVSTRSRVLSRKFWFFILN